MNNSDDKTKELLSEVYRNLKMGSENLCSVTPKIKNRFMLTNVTSQLNKYAKYTEKCNSLIRENSIIVKEPSKAKKLMARGGIMMNTLIDSSDAHIAQMIVRGTNMGANTLGNLISDCKNSGCSKEAVELGEAVVEFEQYEANKMKDFT